VIASEWFPNTDKEKAHQEERRPTHPIREKAQEEEKRLRRMKEEKAVKGCKRELHTGTNKTMLCQLPIVY